MFTDERRRIVWDELRERDLGLFAALLTTQTLEAAAARAGVAVGRGALNLFNLVWLSVSCALRPTMNFATALTWTLRLIAQVDQSSRDAGSGSRAGADHGSGRPSSGRVGPDGKARGRRRSKHDPRKADAALSEEAFAQARAAMPAAYWRALILLLGELFEARHPDVIRWNGFRLLALDGTCVTLPRHKALGEHFGYARNKNGRPAPQARLVMLQLPLARLPWRYEIDARDVGEKTIAARLLSDVRRNDLVLMDRGFFSFGLFSQIDRAGSFFVVRRIKSVRLRTVRTLGPGERLVQWTPAARQWQGGSMRLRVIDYQFKGFRKSALVTNLLDRSRASAGQLVGLESSGAWSAKADQALYHRRWEIETSIREIKQTQQLTGHLRGRTPKTIEYEIHGHLLLYLLLRWVMVQAAHARGLDPLRLSFTAALAQALLAGLVILLLGGGGGGRPTRLLAAMIEQITQHLVPLRPGRSYPRRNDGKVRRTGKRHKLLPAKLRREKA